MYKILYIIFFGFVLTNCSFNKVVKHHGVPFLEKKQKELEGKLAAVEKETQRVKDKSSEHQAKSTFMLLRELFVSKLFKGYFQIILSKYTKLKNVETTEIIKSIRIEPYTGHWVVNIRTKETPSGKERVLNQNLFDSEDEAIIFYKNSIPSQKELNNPS